MKSRLVKYLPSAAKFESCMEKDGLLLRLWRLSDIPLLHSLFSASGLLSEKSADRKNLFSLFFFRRRLSAAFQRIYLMVIQREKVVIGFIGLYDIRIHHSLTVSITVFDSKYRGRGYGRGAVELLFSALQKASVVEKVFAEVSDANERSLSFFRNMGFAVCGSSNETLLLQMPVKDKK
jgi:RimJ/RimL family protein N-acetyltransferase